MDKIISIEKYSDTIGILNMHDEVNKNTFTEEFVNLLIHMLNELKKDTVFKVIILKGLTDIFCAGAAKSELMKIFNDNMQVKDLELSELIMEIPVPVIAAMEGGAVGGGLVVGLCADIVLMGQRSMYGGGFTRLGFSPGMGYTKLLQGLVGEYCANEMIYTGKFFKGHYFRERGLANYVLPKKELFNKALEIAESISEKPRKTLTTIKYSLSLSKRQKLLESRVHEDFMHSITFAQEEVKDIINKNYY